LASGCATHNSKSQQTSTSSIGAIKFCDIPHAKVLK
jgi:hypothetical protein